MVQLCKEIKRRTFDHGRFGPGHFELGCFGQIRFEGRTF